MRKYALFILIKLLVIITIITILKGWYPVGTLIGFTILVVVSGLMFYAIDLSTNADADEDDS